MNKFIDFNKTNCITNNLLSSSILILSYLSVIIFSSIIFLAKNNHAFNSFKFIKMLALLKFFSLLIAAMSSIISPLFIYIYDRFLYNIKSLSGLWLCTIILSLVALQQRYINFTFFILYILFSILGSSFTLTCKYLILKRL